MSSNLRDKIIRLAYNNPELREHLLPVLKEGGYLDPPDYDPEPPIYKWFDEKYNTRKLERLFPQLWDHVDEKDISGRDDITVEFVFDVSAHTSLDEIIEKFNSDLGRQLFLFERHMYPITRDTFKGSGQHIAMSSNDDILVSYDRDGEEIKLNFRVYHSTSRY